MLKFDGLDSTSEINLRETPEMSNLINVLNGTELDPKLQIKISVNPIMSYSLTERVKNRRPRDEQLFTYDPVTEKCDLKFIKADLPLEISDQEHSIILEIKGDKDLINACRQVIEKSIQFRDFKYQLNQLTLELLNDSITQAIPHIVAILKVKFSYTGYILSWIRLVW